MSRIEKLYIRGVRSFGPSHPETISFNTPLTLIVGFNGSGKTTIIECLKYATTGELPPNSKGGAFIHDPDLSGEKSMKAQIKLSFRSTVNESLVLTRNLEVTVARTKRSQKTLDGSLVVRANGERQQIASKVMDLDATVTARLGVSPAVLDAVIFCHQDESLWPMSEPSALKKRFDEIFEALKYSKAIDNLKVIRKKQAEQLRTHQSNEIHFSENKRKGDDCMRQMQLLEKEVQEGREKCEELMNQMLCLQKQEKAKRAEANEHLGVLEKLRSKTEQLQYKKEALQELERRIDIMKESDEDLLNAMAQYEERLERIDEARTQKSKEYQTRQTELKGVRDSLTAQVADKGKHQSDKEKHERQLVTRSKMVQEAAARHEIRGFDGELSDRLMASFDSLINKMLNDRRRDLERLQRFNAEELEQVASRIQDLQYQKATQNQTRQVAKNRMGALERRTTVHMEELNSFNVDEGSEAILQANMKDLEAQLQKARLDDAEADLDGQITKENKRLYELESENADLSRELVECTRMASERAHLDVRKKELVDRTRDLDTMTNTWSEKLTAVLGADWKFESLEHAYQGVVKKQSKVVAEAQQQRDKTEQDLGKLQFKLKDARERYNKMIAERKRCETVVLKALDEVKNDDCSMSQYVPELQTLESDIKEYAQNIELQNAVDDYFKKAEEIATRLNKCYLCERDFREQKEAKAKLLKKIEKIISKKQQEEWQEAKEEAEAHVRLLVPLRPDFETHQRLEKELPPLQKEIILLELQMDGVLRQLEAHDDPTHKQALEALQDIEAFGKIVTKVSQLCQEIGESQAKVDRLASQQSSSTLIRSAEEVQDAQAVCGERTRAVKIKLSKLTAERQRMKELISGLELQRSELRNKISTLAQQLEKKKNVEEKIKEIKRDQAEQKEIMKQADKEIERLEPELQKFRTLREDKMQEGRAKEQVLAEERDKIAATNNELKLINSEIQDYMDRGGEANLNSSIRAIESLEQNISRLEKESRDLTVSINQLNKEIDNSDRLKENIANNISYRKLTQAQVQLQRDINGLKRHNAQEDYDHLTRVANKLEARRSKLSAERERTMGMIASQDAQLAREMTKYEQEYRDANEKWREANIKVQTTRAAIEDLGRYSSALDKAIMQYHSLKMAEINRIVAELWQSTYQGTDIDTILIRSDAESAASSTAVDSKRNYNYRVCMVKGDTEMDMRGRCSAGQKVLASIIIRLALAETFGINCGLIALDEPTTNLDSDNIRSLAESLHGIIKARQGQSNLQLIVITHDEEFLKHMQCSDFCDDFYRVRRDENQNSVIVRENITRISEG